MDDLASRRAALRTNSTCTLLGAVAARAGFGILPTLIADKCILKRLDLGVRRKIDLWLEYHADLTRLPKVRLVVDWLVEAFSLRRYRWLAGRFIHPRDLPDNAAGLSLSGL
jgi:DNA-binding transcriptional LysR family regulator